MKRQHFLLLLFFAPMGLSAQLKTTDERIEIVRPNIEHEATSIWQTINDIAFLEEQGYTIHLPEDPVIDRLIDKSRKGKFDDEDFQVIYQLLEQGLFNADDYAEAIKKVEQKLALVNALLKDIDQSKKEWDWDFYSFKSYKIQFTLYGTGGSYDTDEGSIILWTNKEGQFMSYENPANTIIHEITHMGMEYSLVQKYQLPHGLKERVVDTFVYLMFLSELSDYRIQEMGDPSIDEHLKTRKDIASLNAILSSFVN